MVLEATMICIDNSEWMRNGDYAPNRFQAQADAINLICGAKTQSNPENTVGLLTTAGKGVRVLVTPTQDLGKILSSMHGLEIEGEANLSSGAQVAQLALKHRQNKNQRQRIVLFSGSPVTADTETLVSIGKKLKKNNVAVDIVSFGEEEDGKVEKLEAFLGAVNSNDNSHLVHVPAGAQVLSDVLISSPIFTGDGEGGSRFAAAAAAGAAAAAAAGAGGGFDFGVDPNVDPELALALRVSMEEERARLEAAAKKAEEDNAAAGGSAPAAATTAGGSQAKGEGPSGAGSADVAMHEGGTAPADTGVAPMDDESALLQQALAMSMAQAAAAGGGGGAAAPPQGDTAMVDAGLDDELALALQLSMQEAAAAQGSAQSQQEAGMSQVLGDASFVSSVLASLPGVDPNDPSVRDMLAALNQSPPKTEDKPPEKKDEGKQ